MKRLICSLCALFALVCFNAYADNTTGDLTSHAVRLSGAGHPAPHFADVSDPIAMYNSATDVLTVTLDATYYGEYGGQYIEQSFTEGQTELLLNTSTLPTGYYVVVLMHNGQQIQSVPVVK